MFLSCILLVAAAARNTLALVQAPALPGAPPISSEDRIYTGDQSSNTVTVIKPSTNEVLGTISLGDPRLTNLVGPQYLKSINSHGLGFSRDGKHIVSLSVTSNTVNVIRTLDNSIVSQTFSDRAPHEAFFTADNRTVWVACRGTSFINIIDGLEGGIIGRIQTAPGPSKVLFSPDGKTAYANHILSPSVDIIDVANRKVTHIIHGLADVFSSDMMLSADGTRLWVAHKMIGKVSIIDLTTRTVVTALATGPETNHPNFAIINGTTYGFVTVAAVNATKVYRQDTPASSPVFITAIEASGVEPHGIWPSPDNTRMYVVNEHSDSVDVIDTSTLSVIDTLHVGQEGQALVYVAGAVPASTNVSTYTANLGHQGLSGRVENVLIPVVSNTSRTTATNGSALITIRALPGLDMLQIIGRHLRANVTYVLSASPTGYGGDKPVAVKIPLVEFNASVPDPMGCEIAPQVLGFMKVFGVYGLNTFEIGPKSI
ncbi:hypothetical protein LTR78_010171 [Recurvomyces mirabilis]|uniref:Uncharacterized protein n=1 Tax=Recurvomyces mirabilis TaxID=574656 RepID=A0AAE0TN81_9PEZI|nr:hypothetical protein LTR78_010171 [Recurvomyces mirabilis]KAK5149700.1 hypothetical protein LTS14_010698 [Recurvomyces mirabilis]